MKLVIQIPCFNEAETLPLVFEKMPRYIPGIDEIQFQIIDDGSTDDTARVAESLGIEHIVRIPGKNRRWLGRAFKVGIDHALRLGADIVVNTDGDNQYPSERIPDLVKPIVDGAAAIVIGDRDPGHVREFSFIKRSLQRLGSWVVTLLSGRDAPDPVSGFRAYSREALLKLNVVTDHSYTLDTLVQAAKKGIQVHWIPIKTNPKTRESRLITSLGSMVLKSSANLLRIFAVYEPFKIFFVLSIVFLLPGLGLIGRFLYYYFAFPLETTGKVQSVVVGGALSVIGVQMFVLGILAELLSVNRRLSEEILTRLKRDTRTTSSSQPEDQKDEPNLRQVL